MSLDMALVFQLGRTTIGSALAYKVSNSGYAKGSLTREGAAAAFAVASLACSCSARTGATLLCFYKTGSILTKFGAARKCKLEADYAAEGQRGADQVLACSLIAVVLAVLRRCFVGLDSPIDFGAVACLGNRLTLGFVAFFAACAGDTWASELGVLSRSPPRLITRPWRVAAPGTNGGVSTLGTLASAAGGVAMGLCHGALLMPPTAREVVALMYVGLLAGTLGSLLDSLLGATLQATFYDDETQMIVKASEAGRPTVRCIAGVPFLSNEAVNFVSTAAVALAAALAPRPLLAWAARV